MIYARSSAKQMGKKTDGTEECKAELDCLKVTMKPILNGGRGVVYSADVNRHSGDVNNHRSEATLTI